MITIFLAGHVRGKGRPRFVRQTGRTYTDKETVNYEAALRTQGQEAMGLEIPLAGALVVTMVAYMAVPASWSNTKRKRCLDGDEVPTTKPDVDNIVKCLDALNGVVWIDDKQIAGLRVVKKYHEKPGLLIEVREF